MSAPMPAAAAQLRPAFDGVRLAAEVAELRASTWKRQQSYDVDALPPTTEDWRCLALRSPGGDGTRTDPGGPGTEEFADTEWLDRAPLIREILRSVPAPLRAVRLMALGPGARSIDHFDTKYGPAWGVARLHVPVTTNPDAVLVLGGVTYRWQPGSFWFGDFSREHRVENNGETTRIHLVIDCLVVPGLATLFPAGWQSYFTDGEVLYGRPTVPVQRLDDHLYRFPVPKAFADWEQDDVFAPGTPTETAVVIRTPGGLELQTSEGARFALVHLGDGEFRFAGWSEERTVRLPAGATEATLRTRRGRTIDEYRVPAERADR
ncbi:hypothetical protein Lesp02_59920 [Lentzea sp. NBRC 105346]|uniref:aspartyl/asparaginyl beta-hydroxylase domain-containing protein n=1 Tax=Lentzea sp. NBRC 105346 TaxID=3032205 RepID=UPI0024A1D5BA|nr:aspartyl/asparaginyl beta-hydroxylase domain-containing protein [Lentzea sp. NBRC 105346]GLZ33804.1 hypothetical protein Lesp02_59920 [Lentzea sp. NBRC 105346]